MSGGARRSATRRLIGLRFPVRGTDVLAWAVEVAALVISASLRAVEVVATRVAMAAHRMRMWIRTEGGGRRRRYRREHAIRVVSDTEASEIWRTAEADPGFSARLEGAIDRMDRQGRGVPYEPTRRTP